MDTTCCDKVLEYSQAINKYKTNAFYVRFEILISILVIFLQISSVIHCIQAYQFNGVSGLFIALVFSYIAADFFNGIAHMILDNNTGYTSIAGPFIAAFHMHHATLNYKETNPFKLYFYESGHKFWLAIYLLLLCFSQIYFELNNNLNLCFVAFGILSSIAELSHFWCHNLAHKKKGVIKFLQNNYLLLNLKHHRIHHVEDNVNYAFLNGMSDPLLNIIAKGYYGGYKKNSDLHVAAYIKNKDLLWH